MVGGVSVEEFIVLQLTGALVAVVVVSWAEGLVWNTYTSVVMHWNIITVATRNMYQCLSALWKFRYIPLIQFKWSPCEIYAAKKWKKPYMIKICISLFRNDTASILEEGLYLKYE